MTNFKAGDRVVFDNGGEEHYGRKPGDLGVVVGTDEGRPGTLVTVDWDDEKGEQGIVYENRLRLANIALTSKFKVGDKVHRVGDAFGPTGRVTGVDGRFNGWRELDVEWPNQWSLVTWGWHQDYLELAEEDESAHIVTHIALDETDPFEAVLADMVRVVRKKRADYVSHGASPWENFDRCEDQTRTPRGTAVEMLIEVKNARLRALRGREGEPLNEGLEDSLLDRANYCVIALARHRFPEGVVK